MLNCLSPGRSSTCQCQCTCQGSKASKEGGEKKQQTFLGHFLHRIQITFASNHRNNKRYQLYRETGKDNYMETDKDNYMETGMDNYRETGKDNNGETGKDNYRETGKDN